MDLNNARVLVTGGSSGIGLAIAEHLRQAGAQVAICAREAERLHREAARIGAHGFVADLSMPEQAVAFVDAAAEAMGGIDVVINNAGVGYFAGIAELSIADFRNVLGVNLIAPAIVTQAALRHMLPRRCGSIINIGSTSSQRGFSQGSAYAASKFGLRGMTECWRHELRGHNIRVMLVNPSEVLSDFASAAGFTQVTDDPSKLSPTEIAVTVCNLLRMDDRGFIPELSIWATNPAR